MNAALRIDPTLPVCWESVDTLRIGFDRAEARIHQPSSRAQQLISQLRAGLHPAEFVTAARKAGLRRRERNELLDALSPVLLPRAGLTPPPKPVVSVLGTGRFCDRLRDRLDSAGLSICSERTDETATLTILVERFLAPAADAHHLLIAGMPHIPIRLTDRSMWVGPLVAPGGSPCLACAELRRLDVDPLLAVLAAQLITEVPGAETDACSDTAAALIASVARSAAAGVPELTDRALCYPVRDGIPGVLPSVHDIATHPDCACATLQPTSFAEFEPGFGDEARWQSSGSRSAGSA